METFTQTVTSKATSPIPCPMPDGFRSFVQSVSENFIELQPGHFEANLSIPTRYANADHRLFLQLFRVGYKATLTVFASDGNFVSCSHYGSFTDWQLELTPLFSKLSPQNSTMVSLRAILQLEADYTTTSPYQKAGILGSIRLVATSSICFRDLQIRSQKNNHDEWQFLVSCPLLLHSELADNSSPDASDELSISIELQTKEGLLINSCSLSFEQAISNEVHLFVPSDAAHPWSSEDPYLYRILFSIFKNHTLLESCERMVGLCQIEKQGQTILFNGAPLKLRGLAYREPLTSEGYDLSSDLMLFQKAHVNYLRSLYYPFSEELLSLCDQYGILVEQSAPIEEVGQSLPAFQNAPALRPLFLEQFQEMVLAGRSHPCVLLWCLGHNCVWGDQFALGKQLIRSLDPNRLINFHLPMTIPQDEWIPDVWTVDYSAWNLPADVCYDQMVIFHTQGADNPIGYALGKAQELQIPVLHDAYALVPVYDRDKLETDDGIHEFWGESMKRCYDTIRHTPGALGGAVMAAVDENGNFSPSLLNFCYGILDSSHKPKPEYWHVAMAYFEDPITVHKANDSWTIKNQHLLAFVNPNTGLLTGVFLDHKPIICEGPFLNTGRFFLEPWELISLSDETIDHGLLLTIRGRYGSCCSVTFLLCLYEDASLTTSCHIDSVGKSMPHEVKAGIGLDPGGLDEYGIFYLLPAAIDTLFWSRNALWNQYPSDHVGRPRGIAYKENHADFTSRKANLIDACVHSSNDQIALRLHPENGQSIRLIESPDPHCLLSMKALCSDAANDTSFSNDLCHIFFDGEWYLINDKAGQENSVELMAKDLGAFCSIHFYGTGLTIFGSTDRIHGLCDIWIDGKLVAKNINQHTPLVQMPGMSRGYEKRFHQPLFHTNQLTLGLHECKVIVSGTKEAVSQDTWISIDSVELIHPQYPPRIGMVVSRDYNYPRLTQGNYMRPAVMMQTGDILSCNLSFETISDDKKSSSMKGEYQS